MKATLENLFSLLAGRHAAQKSLKEREEYLLDMTYACMEADKRFENCLIDFFFPYRRGSGVEKTICRDKGDASAPLFTFRLYKGMEYMVFPYDESSPQHSCYGDNEKRFNLPPSRTAYLYSLATQTDSSALPNGRRTTTWDNIMRWAQPDYNDVENSSPFWNLELGQAYATYCGCIHSHTPPFKHDSGLVKLKKHYTMLALIDTALDLVSDDRFTLHVEKDKDGGFYNEKNIGRMFSIHYTNRNLNRDIFITSKLWGALLVYGFRTATPRISIQFPTSEDRSWPVGAPFNTALPLRLTDNIAAVRCLGEVMSFELNPWTLSDATELHGNFGRLSVLCGFLLDVLTMPSRILNDRSKEDRTPSSHFRKL